MQSFFLVQLSGSTGASGLDVLSTPKAFLVSCWTSTGSDSGICVFVPLNVITRCLKARTMPTVQWHTGPL